MMCWRPITNTILGACSDGRITAFLPALLHTVPPGILYCLAPLMDTPSCGVRAHGPPRACRPPRPSPPPPAPPGVRCRRTLAGSPTAPLPPTPSSHCTALPRPPGRPGRSPCCLGPSCSSSTAWSARWCGGGGPRWDWQMQLILLIAPRETMLY